MDYLSRFKINKKLSSPEKQLIIRRCFEMTNLRTKGVWNKKDDSLPVNDIDLSSLYSSEEIPFMGVLYHEEEDYRDRSRFRDMLDTYIKADIKDTLNISFSDYIRYTPLEASILIRACETHKENKLEIQMEQDKALKQAEDQIIKGGADGV